MSRSRSHQSLTVTWLHQRIRMVLRLTKSDSSHNFFLNNKKFAYRSFGPIIPYRVAAGQVRIYKWIVQHHESLTRNYFAYSIKYRNLSTHQYIQLQISVFLVLFYFQKKLYFRKIKYIYVYIFLFIFIILKYFISKHIIF